MVVEHNTEVWAEITENKEKGRWDVDINGKTSKVSSGSAFGEGSWADTYEEAVKKVMNSVKSHNEWCDSYQGTDGKIYRLGEIYHTRLFINDREVPFVDGNRTLMDFEEMRK